MIGFYVLTSPVPGLGALLTIPAIKAKSFGGFCACIFIVGNGLGSLETAANPYITGKSFQKYALNVKPGLITMVT